MNKTKKTITFVILISLIPAPAHAGWFDSLWSSVKENATKVASVFAAAATATAAFLGYKWWQASKKAENLRASRERWRKMYDQAETASTAGKKALKEFKEQSEEKMNTELTAHQARNNQLQHSLDESQRQINAQKTEQKKQEQALDIAQNDLVKQRTLNAQQAQQLVESNEHTNAQNAELKKQQQALDESKLEREKLAQAHAQELERNKEQAATLVANLQKEHASTKEYSLMQQEQAQMAQEELQQRLYNTTAAYNALLKDSAIRKAFETYNDEKAEIRAKALTSLAQALNIALTKEQMEGPLAFHQFVLENYDAIIKKVTGDKYLSELVQQFNKSAPWTRGKKLAKELLQPKPLSNSQTEFVIIEDQSTLPNIVNLVWYFYELAVGKDQKFSDGTFNIEGEELFNIINNYSKKSERSGSGSSHYKEVSTNQYGIDIPQDQRIAWSFPSNKFHLLFGDISSSKYIKDTGKLIFFAKPEPSGTSSVSDFFHHSTQFAASQARKILPSSASNAMGLGSDDDEIYRKERVEQEIIKLATKHFGADNSITKEAKTYGIKALVQHVKQDRHPDLFAKMHEYDHLQLRKGREVILLNHDLLNGTKRPASRSHTPVTVVASSTSSASVSTTVTAISSSQEQKSV